MAKAHLTRDGFYIETIEADAIEGEGTFTPLPAYDPETQVPRFTGLDWIIVPVSARDGYVLPAPIIPREAIDAEHDRRVLAGRVFTVEGLGDVPLEGTEKSQFVLLALKDTARDLKDAGNTAPLLKFTDRDSVDRRATAGQMIALVNAGKAWVQAVHDAKRKLKAMVPIPADYADDRHWPA